MIPSKKFLKKVTFRGGLGGKQSKKVLPPCTCNSKISGEEGLSHNIHSIVSVYGLN